MNAVSSRKAVGGVVESPAAWQQGKPAWRLQRPVASLSIPGPACFPLPVPQLNPRYVPQLEAVLAMPQSVGIVGGRPASSLYFVGFQRRRPAAAAAAAPPGTHASGGEAPREAAAVAAVGVPAGGATAAQAGAAAAPGWQEGSAASSAAAAASTVFYLDPHQVQEVSCCCFCKL